MVSLGKKYRSATGGICEVVATNTGDGSVTLLHHGAEILIEVPEAFLPEIFEEVA